MAQDCLDSVSTTGNGPSLYSSVPANVSLVSPQRSASRTVIYDSASSTLTRCQLNDSQVTPLRKSNEYLHNTPKAVAPLAPHCHITLDNDRRPKSASTILLASQPSNASSRPHKFQRTTYRTFKMKTYRSEDDIMLALQRQNDSIHSNNDDESTLVEQEIAPLNVKALARQFEQKTSTLPDQYRTRAKTPDNNDDEHLSWSPSTTSVSTPASNSGGIKKFVRNGLKLFSTPSQQSNGTLKKLGK
jgi:hypothetical protein